MLRVADVTYQRRALSRIRFEPYQPIRRVSLNCNAISVAIAGLLVYMFLLRSRGCTVAGREKLLMVVVPRRMSQFLVHVYLTVMAYRIMRLIPHDRRLYTEIVCGRKHWSVTFWRTCRREVSRGEEHARPTLTLLSGRTAGGT